MALLLRPERWLAKPPAGTPLDPSHPLANGLRLLIPFTEGAGAARDVVTGRLAYVPVANGKWAARTGGVALTTVAAGESGNLAADPQWQIAAPITILAHAINHTQTFDNTTWFGAANATFSSGNNGYSVYSSSGDSTHHAAFFAGTTFVDLSVGALVHDRPYQIGMTYDGATVKFYVNGVLKNSAAHTGALVYPTTGFQFGQEGDSAAGDSSVTDALSLGIWSRALSGAELQQLAATPYAMLRPRAAAQRFFLPPPAAGATTGTMASAPGVFVSAMAGTSTPPAVTGALATAPDPFVAALSGASAPAGTSGAITAAPAAFASAMSGTSTPPPTSGTIAAAPTVFTSAMAGTSTPPPVTGTMATAPAVFVSAMTGSVGGAGTTLNTNILVSGAGSGGADIAHALVRDSGDRLWSVAYTAGPVDNSGGFYSTNTLRVYRANQTGVPSTFTEQDSAHRPTQIVSPAAAIDGSDLIHVVWLNGWQTGGTIRYNTFDTSTNLWGTSVSLGTMNSASANDDAAGDMGISLALDSAGKPHVVYAIRSPGSTSARHIFYTNRTSGSWSTAAQLDSATLGTNFRCMHPQIIALDDGTMLATWLTFDFNYTIPANGTAYLAKRSAAGTWGAATAFGDTLLGSIDNGPSIFQSEDHTVHLIYLLGDTTSTQVGNNNVVKYLFSADRGATWSATRQPARFVTHDPTIGPDGAGGAYIWAHSQPATYDGLGPDMGRLHLPYGATSWGAWTKFSTNGISCDCTPNVRWSQFFHRSPATVDTAYFADASPITQYIYSEITGNATGTIAAAPAPFTSAMAGTSTPAGITGTMASAPAPFTSAMVGTAAMVGALATAPGPFASAMAGTSTPPAVTGTLAAAPAAFASSMAGTATPPPVTGTMAETPAAFASAMAGTFTAAGSNSGTIAAAPAPFAAALSGAVAPPNETGTMAMAPAPFTTALGGTSTPPPVTGAIAAAPGAFVGALSGTSAAPGTVTGTIVAIPGLAVVAMAGTSTPPPITGTIAVIAGTVVVSLTGTNGALLTLGTATLTDQAVTISALADALV